jgi:hypothetical protein
MSQIIPTALAYTQEPHMKDAYYQGKDGIRGKILGIKIINRVPSFWVRTHTDDVYFLPVDGEYVITDRLGSRYTKGGTC